MSESEKKEEMIKDAMAYNRYFRSQYLETLTLRELLPFCGPMDREKHLSDIEKIEENV